MTDDHLTDRTNYKGHKSGSKKQYADYLELKLILDLRRLDYCASLLQKLPEMGFLLLVVML